MAGRVKVFTTFGPSPGSAVDQEGHIYFTEEDSQTSTNDTSSIGKPSGATNTAYSYERYCRFKVTVAPQTSFTNFRVWSGVTSTPHTGVSFLVGSATSYSDPVITKSTKAVHLLHSTYPSYEQSLQISGTLTDVGDVSNYFIVQVQVNSAASVGTKDATQNIIKFAFDES